MQIVIKQKGKTKLRLWLPTSLLKSKFIGRRIIKQYLKHISKNSTVDCDSEDQQDLQLLASAEKVQYKTTDLLKLQSKLYQAIKHFKRENGTLTLIDVQSADGDFVLIKL